MASSADPAANERAANSAASSSSTGCGAAPQPSTMRKPLAEYTAWDFATALFINPRIEDDDDRRIRERLQHIADKERLRVAALRAQSLTDRNASVWTKLGNWLDQSAGRIPIITFYRHIWRYNRKLLLATVFVNYALPLLLDALPWIFSRRRIANRLREERNAIRHSMISSRPVGTAVLRRFVLLTIMQVILQTLESQLRARVALANKFVIKRMVLERILFSEAEAFRGLRLQELESKLYSDITQTLQLFNYTIPSIFSTSYTFARDAAELYEERHRLHPLMVLRPLALGAIGRVASLCKFVALDSQRERTVDKNARDMRSLLYTVVDGITDIQLNNCQDVQLEKLDNMIEKELSTSHVASTVLDRTWRAISSRSLFDFLTEVVTVDYVMRKLQLSHEKFRKVQLDIDHVLSLGRSVWRSFQVSARVFEQQRRLMNLLSLPTFRNTDKGLRRDMNGPFRSIEISGGLRFSFGAADPPTLALDEPLTICAGQMYALVGHNQAGKSTLAHLLCRMYDPDEGSIRINSIPYTAIAREFIRDTVVYVSQRPFIFPGTVRENIAISRASASEADIRAAARAAGIFALGAEGAHCPEQTQPIQYNGEGVHSTECDEDSILNRDCGQNGSALSGGFIQSVALARAFLKNASVLILDESMSQMDAYKRRHVVWPQLLRVVKQRRIALVLITHDAWNLGDFDKIIVLERGRVAAQGSQGELEQEKAPAYLALGDADAKPEHDSHGSDESGHATAEDGPA